MAEEPQADQKKRTKKIYERLKKEYPDAECALDWSTPFELLVAAILSAQCTDAKVNQVTADLFKEAHTPEDFADMHQQTLQARVRPTGFYRNKAKNIQAMSEALLEKHDGEVPDDMDALVELPGVARKTANLVRETAFGKPGIITDTHVIRLSQRLGLTENEDPVKIEFDLQGLLHHNSWGKFSHVLVFHGRRVCTAKKPACDECVAADLCPSAFDFPHFGKGGKG